MIAVTLMQVAVTGGDTGLAQNDDAGRTAVDTECAAGAHVFVDDEHDMIIGVGVAISGRSKTRSVARGSLIVLKGSACLR